MEKKIKDKYKLPDSIKVEVKRTKSGFYAYLPDYPGCMTVAKNFGELIENVNDAILTYFNVSRREAKKIDLLYFPDIHIPKISASIVKPKKKLIIRPLQFIPIPSQYFYA